MRRVSQRDTEASNLRINNSRVVKRVFTVQNGTLDKEEVSEYVKKLQNKYKNKNLTYLLSIDTPFGFRSGKQFNNLDQPNFPDKYDWKETTCFIVYAWKRNSVAVGKDVNNDCLFNSISSIVTHYRLPKDVNTAATLKQKLRLGRKDKIPLALFGNVEDLLKINLNMGQHFISKNKYKMTVNLELEGIDHIIPKRHNDRSDKLIKIIPHRKQRLILCETLSDNVLCYDGINKFHITYEEYFSKKREIFGDDIYTTFEHLDDETLKMSLEQKYEWFICEIDKLKELTNGKIDLSRSGYKTVNEALKSIYYSLLCFDEPEPLTEQEQFWIFKSFMGGLMFGEPKKFDYAFGYDKNSAYPAKMIDQYFQFPIKQGEFTHYEKLPDVIQFGIYRAIIMPHDDKNINKLFRFNSNNYYTHYDITLAQKLNLEIELIQDCQANVLLYTKYRAYGSQYFKQLVMSLYELKPKSKLVKSILNKIWGSLCSRYKIERTTMKPINLTNEDYLIEIIPFENDFHKIKYLKNGKFYKYDYARLGCFLTSAVRKDMALDILPFKDNVFRCHTDSMISDVELPLKISKEIGDYKLENQGRCVINNSMDAKFKKNE